MPDLFPLGRERGLSQCFAKINPNFGKDDWICCIWLFILQANWLSCRLSHCITCWLFSGLLEQHAFSHSKASHEWRRCLSRPEPPTTQPERHGNRAGRARWRIRGTILPEPAAPFCFSGCCTSPQTPQVPHCLFLRVFVSLCDCDWLVALFCTSQIFVFHVALRNWITFVHVSKMHFCKVG